MVINRFTQPVVSRVNPISFEQASFFPLMQRQRHDEAMQSNALMQSALGNVDVLPDYLEEINNLVNPLQQDLNQVSEQLAKEGVSKSNATQKLMDLSAKQARLFSPTGDIGRLQQATQQFRTAQQELKDFFKETPEIANFKLQQMAPASVSRDANGNLVIGNINTPGYVKHIPEAEILDRLNDAISKLKPSDLKRYGISKEFDFNDFDSLWSKGTEVGVSPQQIQTLLNSLMSQEEAASIQQYGQLYGLSGEDSMKIFGQRLQGLAAANAYSRLEEKNFQTTDDLRLHLAKQKQEQEFGLNFNYEFDSNSQEIKIGGFDDSYFKPHEPKDIPGGAFGMSPSGQIVLPTNRPGDMSTTKRYKPFNDQQKLDAFEIISTLTNTPIENIPVDFIDSDKGRKMLKDYFDQNKGKYAVQPKYDNTDQLREYGNNPEKASQDVLDNYRSRLLFDVKTGRQIDPNEFENNYLGEGKLKVVGAYSSENPFSSMLNLQGDEAYFTNPLKVNIVNEDGKVIKEVAVSRSPSYLNTEEGAEEMQFNKTYNNAIRKPNIYTNDAFVFMFRNQQSGKQEMIEQPYQIKYNTNTKGFDVRSTDGSFKDFSVPSVKLVPQYILENRN